MLIASIACDGGGERTGSDPGAGGFITPADAVAGSGSDSSDEAAAAGQPFDILVLAELRRIGRVEELHVSRCMADAGFDFAVSNLAEPSLQERIVGVLEPDRDGDAGYRASHGYGYWMEASLLQQLLSGRSVGGDSAGKINQARIDALTSADQERWVAVLFGPPGLVEEYRDPSGATLLSVPSAGCYAAARRQMWGDLQTYLRVKVTADDLRAEYTATRENDRELAALEGDWSACMARHGYDLDSRADAYTQALNGYRSGYSDAAKSSELAIAGADAECVVETSYTERHVDIQSAAGARFAVAKGAEADQILAELRAVTSGQLGL